MCSSDLVPVRLEIDPSYFGEPNDLDRFVAAVEATREFLGRGPLGTIVDRELIPGPTKLEAPQVRGSILRYATTLYHYSSSCQMGVQLDRPVDPRFRLRGIEGLRICDASVLPSVLGCNPQTTLMMMAIRCADWLVGERN